MQRARSSREFTQRALSFRKERKNINIYHLEFVYDSFDSIFHRKGIEIY